MLLIVVFSGYGSVSGAMISTERHMRPRPQKKEVPTLKLKDLAPPFLEYAYFEGHDLRPFVATLVDGGLLKRAGDAEGKPA